MSVDFRRADQSLDESILDGVVDLLDFDLQSSGYLTEFCTELMIITIMIVNVLSS